MTDIFLRWIGGAGFVISHGNWKIGIDLYLSDSCMKEDGRFKRLTPSPVAAEDLNLKYLLASHEHGDHLDAASVNVIINMDSATRLICPSGTASAARRLGVPYEKIIKLDRGQAHNCADFTVRAVMADHGNDSPDAVGFIITVAGRIIYFMGDAAFRTDMRDCIGNQGSIDILLVPINGRFGNPDAREAAYFTQMFSPRIVVPCHFWLFAEHGGDPGEFAIVCAEKAPETAIKILAIGEEIVL